MFAGGFYGLYRTTRRSRSDMDAETVPYTPLSAASTPVVAEVAQEAYIEAEAEIAETTDADERPAVSPTVS